MANEDGSEDRLTKNEFAELIQHLSVQEILTIEYRIDINWRKLFSRKSVSTHTFFCNLCVLETSSFKNLLAHIDGRKHKLQMERVKQLYHPAYTHPKNDKDDIENFLSEKDDAARDACATSKNILNKPNQAPVVANNEKEKLQNVMQNKTYNTKSITTGCVQSKLDICMKNCVEVDTQNEISLGEYSNICNKGEIKKVKVIDQKQEIKSKVNDETSILKSDAKELKQIIRLVDEKGSLANINREEALKKKNIVVNPAAALSIKLNSKKAKADRIIKNHQYQTDKIMIPTVHKHKAHSDESSATLQRHPNDPPKFSVKSYSSSPSDNYVHGILGVEYVIKILKTRNDDSPRYECGLCELVFDGFAMQKHLEGYNHRLKFCEKHFPTAIRQYRQYMQNVPEHEVFKVMAPILAKLAVAIEQHHGRNLPYECYERDFCLNRHEILAKAFSCRHASEQYGPTFTHVVGSKEVDHFINNRHNYMPSSSSRTIIFDIKPGTAECKINNRQQNCTNSDNDSNLRHRHSVGQNMIPPDGTTYKSHMSSRLYDDVYPSSAIYNHPDNRNVVQHIDDKTYNLMVDDFLKGTLKAKKCAPRENRKRSFSPDRNLSYGKRKLLSPLHQNDIWQTYRHMVDRELYNLDECFKRYRKDPETHPSYNEEWQKFWKRRKDELVSAGLDHRKYNYQPEWVRFIKIRMEELYSQEVENLKLNSRERLCLPLTNDNVSDIRYQVLSPKKNQLSELISTVGNTEPATPVLSTPSILLRSENTSGPQVVSVLRLMTALEDSLGSLGPKIIHLLSKALQVEKTNPLQVSAVILNEENCSLIETAKEKFKGLLITGLFEGSKKRVLNQVVNDAETLLQYAYHFKQQLASERCSVESSTNRVQKSSSLPIDQSSTNISSMLKNQNQSGGSNSIIKKTRLSSSSKTENFLTCVDKKELASKLAASLVAQGKTDFDPQQLQQLISVYKLIEKKKRENAEPFQSNKDSLQDSTPSKMTLSDILSDLLKTSSEYTTSHISRLSNSSHSVSALSSQILSGVFGDYIPSNYLNNAAQSVSDSFDTSSDGGGNRLEQRSSYGLDYANHQPSNQQNSNLSNMYCNQYQNTKRISQNWGLNMGVNQNYSNFNHNYNWQNF